MVCHGSRAGWFASGCPWEKVEHHFSVAVTKRIVDLALQCKHVATPTSVLRRRQKRREQSALDGSIHDHEPHDEAARARLGPPTMTTTAVRGWQERPCDPPVPHGIARRQTRDDLHVVAEEGQHGERQLRRGHTPNNGRQARSLPGWRSGLRGDQRGLPLEDGDGEGESVDAGLDQDGEYGRREEEEREVRERPVVEKTGTPEEERSADPPTARGTNMDHLDDR